MPAVLEALTAANELSGETVDAEPMILTIVTTEAVIWDTIAVVTATLLPGAVLRLPATRAIVLPSNLLLVRLSWTSLLCRAIVLLLTLLSLLIVLHSGLLLSL